MTIFVTILHAVACIVLIFVVLLQRGKGAEIGAVFGGSAASTLFGSRGAGNFLTKLTTASAAVFMATSFYLAYVALSAERSSVYDTPPPAAASTTPSAAAGAAPAPANDFVEVMSEAPARADATPEENPAASANSDADASAPPQ
ncbi:MAG: preprotein translocase subunit SecG [Deltaproteobacteria bacterium]|nr:preprotein translocase subunit SecG [Deltaproteobacteria bacterium]